MCGDRQYIMSVCVQTRATVIIMSICVETGIHYVSVCSERGYILITCVETWVAHCYYLWNGDRRHIGLMCMQTGNSPCQCRWRHGMYGGRWAHPASETRKTNTKNPPVL